MKKIFTLILGLLALTSVFAQNGRGRDYSSNYHDYTYNNNNYGHDRYDQSGYGNYGYDRNHNYHNNSNYDSRDYQGYDRQYNNRRNRSYDVYDRDHRVYREERDRNKTLKGVGVGMVIGGVLGAILSH